MIITIGRKCGCCGDEIGHALEQIYHIPFYDRSVISELAKGYGMYDRYPDFYGETPMDTLMYTISQTESENVFYETPKKALSEILDGKNCIILGRCGNYVFKDRKDKLAIFLTAIYMAFLLLVCASLQFMALGGVRICHLSFLQMPCYTGGQ